MRSMSNNNFINQCNFYVIYALELLLLLFFIFRDPKVGTDTLNYIYDFENIRSSSLNIQFVFYYFQQIANLVLFGEYKMFFLLIAIIVICALNISLKKYSVDPCLTFVLWTCFYYGLLLNILRQTFLLVIIYGFFVPILLNKKYTILKLFLFVIMFGVHYSAIYFILIYLLSLKEYPRKMYILLLAMSFVIKLGASDISALIFPWINYLTMLLGLPDYFGDMNMKNDLSGNSLLFFNLLSCLFVYCFNEIKENKMQCFMFNIFIIGQCVANILYFFGPLHRIVFYSQYAFIFLLPYCISTMSLKFRILGRMFFLLLSFIYFYMQFYLGNTGEIFN